MRMQVAYYEIRLFIAVGGPKLPLHTKDLAFLLHTTCKRLKYAFCILMKTNSVFVVLLGHFNLFIQVYFPSITIPVPHKLKAWSRDLELEVGVDGVIHKFLCTAGHKKLMLYGIIMR